MRKLRVFVASPADTATERAKVETIASRLKSLADDLDIVLDVVDWRAVVPDMGRPEQVILDQLEPTAWDVFIGILWHRFGTPPGGEDSQAQKEYLVGTEEEFKVAYRLWQQFGKPRILMYRCTRAIPPDALDPDQFKRVKEFFAQFEAGKGEHPACTNRSIPPKRSKRCCSTICKGSYSNTGSTSRASRWRLRSFRHSRPRSPTTSRAARRSLGAIRRWVLRYARLRR